MRTTINYTYEPDGVDVPVVYEFEITGNCVPMQPATRDEPASGGYAEDITAQLVAIQDMDGEPVVCTADTAAAITKEFQDKIDKDENLYRELDEKLCEAAGHATAEDRDYERARNRGWED